MKKMKYTIVSKASIVLLLIFVLTSCDLFKLDINTDPSSPSVVSPDLVLPNIMVSASTTFGGGFNRSIHGFLGQMSSSDDFNLSSSSFSGTWTSLYAGPLKDLDAQIKYTTSVGTFPGYLGMAQVLKALYFSYIVDVWGDVPYFTAFNGDNAAAPETNPKYDKAVDIYADLFTLLDAAIVNLNITSSVNYASGDPIYSGNRASWVKAANSLKLKLYVQIRRAPDLSAFGGAATINAKVQALVSAPASLISTAAEDMDFRFNAALTPDYRHPWFTSSATATVYNGTYLSHQMMLEMLEKKDPRWPFYFKRQASSVLNLADATERGTSPCSSIPGCQYGYMVVGNGGINVLDRLKTAGIIPFNTYVPTATDFTRSFQNSFMAGLFGRDRSDNSGAPADGALRLAFGAYPGGGYYDDNFPVNFVITAAPSATAANPTLPTARKPVNNGGNGGGSGNGLFPMINSTLVKFYIVEAMLSGMATSIAPENVFESAVREHIDRVSAKSVLIDTKAIAVTTATRDAYVANEKGLFTTATSADAKLDVLWKQGWYSNWGNSIDSYNAFRRTGKPTSLQLPLNRIRQFPLSIPYAIDELTLNKNAPANAPQFDTPEAALFWDVLKYKF